MADGGSRYPGTIDGTPERADEIFARSLRRARLILRNLPLWCLALALSLLYVAARAARAAASALRGRKAALRLGLAVVPLGALLVAVGRPPATGHDARPGTPAASAAHEHAIHGHEPLEPAPHAPAAGHADHEAEAGEPGTAAAEGVSVTVTVAEAVAHQLGESLSFFEFGGKINEIFAPLKTGDTDTAVSKGAGAVTEYGVAALLVDSFEVMALIASGVLTETMIGVAGSMAIVRTAVAVGEKVEEAAHHSLKGAAEPEPQPGTERRAALD